MKSEKSRLDSNIEEVLDLLNKFTLTGKLDEKEIAILIDRMSTISAFFIALLTKNGKKEISRKDELVFIDKYLKGYKKLIQNFYHSINRGEALTYSQG